MGKDKVIRCEYLKQPWRENQIITIVCYTFYIARVQFGIEVDVRHVMYTKLFLA